MCDEEVPKECRTPGTAMSNRGSLDTSVGTGDEEGCACSFHPTRDAVILGDHFFEYLNWVTVVLVRGVDILASCLSSSSIHGSSTVRRVTISRTVHYQKTL